MKTMTPYDAIKARISDSVPYAALTGIRLESIADGCGEALLPTQEATSNHIGSQHAGALFTLGESASGAAMAGGFLPVLLSVRPVAANAEIQYKSIARGAIGASASVSRPSQILIDELEVEGAVRFRVDVTMRDQSESEVATMQVDWHVSKANK